MSQGSITHPKWTMSRPTCAHGTLVGWAPDKSVCSAYIQVLLPHLTRRIWQYRCIDSFSYSSHKRIWQYRCIHSFLLQLTPAPGRSLTWRRDLLQLCKNKTTPLSSQPGASGSTGELIVFSYSSHERLDDHSLGGMISSSSARTVPCRCQRRVASGRAPRTSHIRKTAALTIQVLLDR
jgi:hypothetical protein